MSRGATSRSAGPAQVGDGASSHAHAQVPAEAPAPAHAATPSPAALPTGVRLHAMALGDLDALMLIEARAYAFPWSRGNFIDSLAAGYLMRVLQDEAGHLLGYYVAMLGFEEMHLLNITVAPASEGRGLARAMLADLVRQSRAAGSLALWLEVRESNERARALYERQGFRLAGRRRGYYPAAGATREDAILMTLDLANPAPFASPGAPHVE